MKVNRAKFIQHLQRLACAEQCKEVVFSDAFAANALTADQLLMISAPGFSGVEPLKEPIGVSDLGLLTKACKLLQGEGNTGIEVDVYVDGNRLVIDDGARGVQKLILSAPGTIATRIEDETVEKLLDAAEGGIEVPLARSVLEGVCSAYRLYKAEEVELQIGPSGGKVCVGTEKTHRAEFILDGAKAKAKAEYTLLFGSHLIDVFSIVTDFSSAALHLNGAAKPALVTDGEYQYVLSPRARSVDEQKPAVKKERKKKATAAAE